MIKFCFSFSRQYKETQLLFMEMVNKRGDLIDGDNPVFCLSSTHKIEVFIFLTPVWPYPDPAGQT